MTPYSAERVGPVVVAEMVAEGLVRDAGNPESWYSADGLPYGYTLDRPDHETDPAELALLERAVGKPMGCDVGLHIFVSSLEGRPVLARLAQRVAEQAEGWVFVEFQAPPSADLLRYLGNGGRCVPVGGHVHLDAAAMAAWCAHPDFHVVK